MKKVTINEFFSTMVAGLWQSVCWVFKVFNPKYKTCFWRVIWSVFAVCLALVTAIGVEMYLTERVLEIERDDERTWLSENVYVYGEPNTSNRYIKNYKTGKKIVDEVSWYDVPGNGDELLLFRKHGKVGYLDMNTGDIVIAPKYDSAWMFSEGLAAVCVKDSVFFIDKMGNELYKELGLCKKKHLYEPDYVFKDGRCLVVERESQNVGLLQKDGTWAIEPIYNHIYHDTDLNIWHLYQDNYTALVDENLHEFFGGKFYNLQAIDADHIYVMPERGVRMRYNLKGELLDECVISETRQLLYDTDKMFRTSDSEGDYTYDTARDVATCICYSIGYCEEGLMSKSGKIITPAIYCDITAIGKDLYRCQYDGDNAVLLNSRGEKVNL